RRRQYQYDARRQQGDGGGVFGDNQFTSTLSVNFHFPRIPRRTYKKRVASLEKAQLERLRTAQRAWITFRDAQCRYEAGVYEGGSMAPMVHSSCLTQLTEARTKDLNTLPDQP
ncbi:lysozyme inhibitor LprI family protein, partial [Aeromonas caviae]|uniref:lysozyme inhibitor LprI family protein n=1 Tax=Aeromonas caviae TaxID=648 RepID=UPI0038D0EB6A